jgi:NAD(P)-dependent dehydrogenase (short-subunit alcohol dehydrogenase family)
LNQAVTKLNALPGIKGEAVGIPANVSHEAEIRRLIDDIKKTESTLHILVANAGATYGGAFDTTPDSFVAKMLDLNVRGVFNLVKMYDSSPCLFDVRNDVFRRSLFIAHNDNERVIQTLESS